jgi:hypothetical protein
MILAQKADHAVPLPVAALLARGFFCFTTGEAEGTDIGAGAGAATGEGIVVNSAITTLRSSSLRFFMREIIA